MQAAFVATHLDVGSESIADSLSDLYALLPKFDSKFGARIGIGNGNGDANHRGNSPTSAAVTELLEHLSRFGEAVGKQGLNALQNVQARLAERILPFVHSELPAEFALTLDEWLHLNFNYLAEPSASDRWSALIDHLNSPIWNDPLTPGQVAIIHRLFEVTAATNPPSFLTTAESAAPIIDADAANVIAASLDAITSSGKIPVLDLEEWPEIDSSNDKEAGTATDDVLEVLGEASSAESLEIPPSIAELVTLIREELTASESSLQSVLQIASASVIAGARPSLEDYRWHLERLANAIEAVGLKGLHDFIARVLESTTLSESSDVETFCHFCEKLDRWPALVKEYLDHVGQAEACQAMVDFAGQLDFVLPLDADTSQELYAALQHPALEALTPEIKVRPEKATSEHVALNVPDDINPELLDSMLHELPSQTQEFSGALQRVASGNGTLEDIRVAQRIAHTLKGAANTVGIRGIAELAHHLEDIFLHLQEREALPGKSLARALVDSADCLEAMSDALVGAAPAPSQALEVLQEVLNWANRIDREGLAEEHLLGHSSHAVAPVADAESSSSTDLVVAEEADRPLRSENAKPLVEHHTEVVSTPMLRVPTTHIDDLLRLSGESKIVGGQLKEGLRRVDAQLNAVRRQSQLFQQLVNELEQLVDIRGITLPRLNLGRFNQPQAANKANAEFDALEMDQYSELHTVSRRLAEVAMDSREWSAAAQNELHSLEDLLLIQTRHSNETQGAVLKMRMVPATTIVGRLQRGVRQTCRLLDKDVQLIVTGAETLIDSDSLNQLVDPLMHLMRNAIDHGIESGHDRIAKGKPAQGLLTIEFAREGNQIAIRCIDDGKGLDYEAIRAIAEMRGLISADTRLTQAQLGRLIFEPGFSTRSEVTQISGRGIGLDIVHSRVQQLKGTFDVQSEFGSGCRFVIRLPATLISAHALLVKHAKHTVAIASRGVRQILDAHAGKIITTGNRLSLQVGNEMYEAFRLETLLGQSSERRDAERGPRPALLIEVSADRICAVLVQSVVDTIDLVVKPLGPYVPKMNGLIGATILGDGGVAPVVDLPDLLRTGRNNRPAFGETSRIGRESMNGERLAHKQRLPLVLVVDDSLSVRRAMEQLLRDAGFEVRLARDGLEAVALLEVKKPDLMLVDLEMPRMNGMELTTHVRNRQETRDLPVIMITSRSTEKHRKQAEVAGVNHYLTKPYAEDVLLQHLHTYLAKT